MDTLQNMRAFSCVAQLGSFTAAAAQLDTTTANVSRAVSNLEAICKPGCSTAPPGVSP